MLKVDNLKKKYLEDDIVNFLQRFDLERENAFLDSRIFGSWSNVNTFLEWDGHRKKRPQTSLTDMTEKIDLVKMPEILLTIEFFCGDGRTILPTTL